MGIETPIYADSLLWTEHDGGKCPLPYGAMVYLRFANGDVSDKPSCAGFWEHYWTPGVSAHGVRRSHIVAYRPAIDLPARLDRIARRRAA